MTDWNLPLLFKCLGAGLVIGMLLLWLAWRDLRRFNKPKVDEKPQG